MSEAWEAFAASHGTPAEIIDEVCRGREYRIPEELGYEDRGVVPLYLPWYGELYRRGLGRAPLAYFVLLNSRAFLSDNEVLACYPAWKAAPALGLKEDTVGNAVDALLRDGAIEEVRIAQAPRFGREIYPVYRLMPGMRWTDAGEYLQVGVRIGCPICEYPLDGDGRCPNCGAQVMEDGSVFLPAAVPSFYGEVE